MKDKEYDQIIRSLSWSAGPGCHGGCGVDLYIKDGKLEKVEGVEEHPYNMGTLCPRALAMKEYIYHKDRITKPLLRVGKRGEDKWKEISWDEAYDYIEKNMRHLADKYGPETMAFIQGTGRDAGGWLCLLAYNYGSPNWIQSLNGNACYHPRLNSMKITMLPRTLPSSATSVIMIPSGSFRMSIWFGVRTLLRPVMTATTVIGSSIAQSWVPS